jgi:predicted Zn-dependent protease
VASLRHDVGLASLQRAAGEDGPRALVARRLQATLLTGLSFYLTRDLFAAERWRDAAAALAVAAEVDPAQPVVWYNLACAHARSGAPKRALEALERAVETGYEDAAHLASDPDLASLREEPGFAALLARLGG